MEAKSINRKSFVLTENGQQLGELVYENIFTLKAEIRLGDPEVYLITTHGIFGTKITVTKNGNETADLKMNWRGQIVLSFEDGREFLLKAKGVFQDSYIIEDKDGQKLIQFHPRFDWSKFNYNYTITYDKPQDVLLILLGVYAANYFIACMSGGMG